MSAPSTDTVPLQQVDPDSPEAEVAFYPCGTVAIGQYEPCPHSSVQVLCCSCAGCAHEVWTCGRIQPRPSWVQYEAAYISTVYGTNAGLWTMALAILVLFCTQVPEWILFIWYLCLCLAVAGVVYLGIDLVHAVGHLL